MKRIVYLGRAIKDIAAFPTKAKQRIVTALTMVSAGIRLGPHEFKYISTVGTGVYELRVKAENQYRVFYVVKFDEAIYVLHAFVKKTQQTSDADIALGSTRYKALLKERQERGYE